VRSQSAGVSGKELSYAVYHTERRRTDTLSIATATIRVPWGRGLAAMVKKILTWGGLAFLIFFVAYRPTSAADVFKSIGGTLQDIAQGFGDFFSNLVA
jgi:hypothetical protein